ncbi:hypothetical protein BDV11DRAFT_142596 [Aspergillus similis]
MARHRNTGKLNSRYPHSLAIIVSLDSALISFLFYSFLFCFLFLFLFFFFIFFFYLFLLGFFVEGDVLQACVPSVQCFSLPV